MKILVTGGSGFVGRFLIDEILASMPEASVLATVFGDQWITTDPRLLSEKIDLQDRDAVIRMVEKFKPDWVFHLAALSSPKNSFFDDNKTLVNNVVVQANLLNALIKYSPNARTLIVGSGEEYGVVTEDNLPINEQCPLNPVSPYAVSKIAQDFLALQYFHSYNLPVIRVRPFNHIGPGQPPIFVVSAFCEQIAKIENNQQDPKIKVGNLNASRDFTDVHDMVKAYILAIDKGQPGEVYNLGSGNEIKISNLLKYLLASSKINIQIEIDSNRMQPSPVERMICDSSKFYNLTGWKPQIDIHLTFDSVLDYWRTKVKGI